MLRLRRIITLEPASRDPVGSRALGNDPRRQWLFRSLFNMSDSMDFDVPLRHVGRLPNPLIPAYTAVDMRLAWRPDPRLEASITAQNLLDDRHIEYQGEPTTAPRQFERGRFLKLLWRQ
jgi:iron complex outermembrane receptor protein